MSADTPYLSIGPQGVITPPAKFTYNGYQVDIVRSDAERLIGRYWQIKIDGIFRSSFVFSSARKATEYAKGLIDAGEE
jgi:hypothetical protein